MFIFGKKDKPSTQSLIEESPSTWNVSPSFRDDGLIPISRVLDEDKQFTPTIPKFFGTKKPKLNQTEMEILTFCHNHDMISLLREDFAKNKVDYSALDGRYGCSPELLK